MKYLISFTCLFFCCALGAAVVSILFKVSMGTAIACMALAFFSQVFGAIAMGVLK